jgi:hypothetical protein
MKEVGLVCNELILIFCEKTDSFIGEVNILPVINKKHPH